LQKQANRLLVAFSQIDEDVGIAQTRTSTGPQPQKGPMPFKEPMADIQEKAKAKRPRKS